MSFATANESVLLRWAEKINIQSNLSPTNSADNLPATPRANSPALFGPGVANTSNTNNNFQFIEVISAELVGDEGGPKKYGQEFGY